jgi:hypothetical protein
MLLRQLAPRRIAGECAKLLPRLGFEDVNAHCLFLSALDVRQDQETSEFDAFSLGQFLPLPIAAFTADRFCVMAPSSAAM